MNEQDKKDLKKLLLLVNISAMVTFMLLLYHFKEPYLGFLMCFHQVFMLKLLEK